MFRSFKEVKVVFFLTMWFFNKPKERMKHSVTVFHRMFEP